MQIAGNKIVMLKTHILYGEVSFQENDVHFRKLEIMEIGKYLITSLKV